MCSKSHFEKGVDFTHGDPPNPCIDVKMSTWYFAKEKLESRNISWHECKKFAVKIGAQTT